MDKYFDLIAENPGMPKKKKVEETVHSSANDKLKEDERFTNLLDKIHESDLAEKRANEGIGEQIYQEALEYIKKQIMHQIDTKGHYDEIGIRDEAARKFGITTFEAEDIILNAVKELDLGDQPGFESKIKESKDLNAEAGRKKLTEQDYEPDEEDPDAPPPPPEEVKEPEKPVEARKEYLGKTEDTHYYFITDEGEEGEIEDFVVVDQEGVKRFSARDHNIEVSEETVVDFIIDAIREVDIASIERGIFLKYILPRLEEEEMPEVEMYEEPKKKPLAPEEEEPERLAASKQHESKIEEGFKTDLKNRDKAAIKKRMGDITDKLLKGQTLSSSDRSYWNAYNAEVDKLSESKVDERGWERTVLHNMAAIIREAWEAEEELGETFSEEFIWKQLTENEELRTLISRAVMSYLGEPRESKVNEQLTSHENNIIFINKASLGDGWQVLKTREGSRSATVIFTFVSEEAADAAGTKIATAIGGVYVGKEDPRGKPSHRMESKDGERIAESKTNERKINELTTWTDLGWKDLELDGVAPDIRGWTIRLKSDPTQDFKVSDADEKFIQPFNHKEIPVGDGFAWEDSAWELVDPEGNVVEVDRRKSESKEAPEPKEMKEMKVTDPQGNTFDVYVLLESDTDVIISINEKEFSFSPEFVSMWKDETGKISEEGLRELTLDALSNMDETDYHELLTKSEKQEEGKETPGKRDGTGPFKGSRQKQMSDVGKRKEAGEPCPMEKNECVCHIYDMKDDELVAFYKHMDEGYRIATYESDKAEVEKEIAKRGLAVNEDVAAIEKELDILDGMSMQELRDAMGDQAKTLPEKEDLIDAIMLKKFGKDYTQYQKRAVGIEKKDKDGSGKAMEETEEAPKSEEQNKSENENVGDIEMKEEKTPESLRAKAEELLKEAEKLEKQEEGKATKEGDNEKQILKKLAECGINEIDVAKGVKALIKMASDALKAGEYSKVADYGMKLADIENVVPSEAEREADKDDKDDKDDKKDDDKDDKDDKEEKSEPEAKESEEVKEEETPAEEPEAKENSEEETPADESKEDSSVEEKKDKDAKAKAEKVKKEKAEKEAKAKKEKAEKEAKAKKEKEEKEKKAKAKKESKIQVDEHEDITERKAEERLRGLLE